MAYTRVGESEAAITDYTKCLELNPNFADAYYNRGVTQFKIGNQTEAFTDLHKAAELFKVQGDSEHAERARDTLEKLQAQNDT